MAIRLRLAMHGHRNHRIFHLVAIDRHRARNAKPAELLGIYDPHLKEGETTKTFQWSVDRIRYWLHVGALPSKSVLKLLETGGILQPGSPYHPKPKSPPTSSSPTAKSTS
ncbi:ribosomal protein S16 domain-containing protein [Crucibulum laeve]|uniref:Ribosomal protein S16 domain-containing protein n=1 Tax=Crucibulum laeve TaxID=68775 RepID=A0A5C3M7G1_9AGAR|nr:ribosomal protein S16 domain-containing protein [Crucibulum laeve]